MLFIKLNLWEELGLTVASLLGHNPNKNGPYLKIVQPLKNG